jgi:hypothetical protein
MREFFLQCLVDLELRTGHRQLHWMRQGASSQEEFDRQKKILIDGMMIASEKFSYIPEGFQKKYILQEMIEDQQYDSLNSRIIWRWLDKHKSKHSMNDPEREEEITPEKQKEYDEARAKWEPKFNALLEEMKKPIIKVNAEIEGKLRDPMLEELRSKFPKTEPRPKFIIGQTCNACQGFGHNDDGVKETWRCEVCEGTGEINRVEIQADNREEAQKAYDATFK